MTIFAVMCAGMFPLLHMGRPWFFYWLYPFPNVAGMWPQFRSPLTWDVFAVTTYFTVSLVFWYIGLVPDLAALRDRAEKRWQRIVYGILALGWRGSAIHWRRYEKVYLILAGISTLFEPILQGVGLTLMGGGLITPIMLGAYMLTAIPHNFAQVVVFRKYGFVASILVRQSFYLIWHIGYGNFLYGQFFG